MIASDFIKITEGEYIMSDTYCKQLYRDITSNYYQEFTSFMTKHWYPEILGDSEITQEERQGAYQNFYKTIKDARIANRQTIRRWFGLSEQSIPSRTYIFRIALAAGLSVEETEEYLQLGISQQGIQDNDYREFIARYCLDHGLGIDKCRRMIEFYERKSQNRGKWEQESNTNWVREQYTVVRDYPEEEFLVWMHKHQKYFKGYSLTVLKCYRQLVEECLIFLRKDVMESLAQELQAAGFMEWREQKGQKGVYGGTEIERFVKNRLRTIRNPLSPDKAKEIRRLASVAYAPQDRISDLVLELYSTMPGRNKHQDKYALYNALGGEIHRVDKKYISELLNSAVLREKQMILQMELAAETDEAARRTKEKELKKFKQRIHLVQRSDLLVLAQYIIYRRMEEISMLYEKSYSAQTAKDEFCELADGMLELCGMRRVDDRYMLDHVLLSCFAEEDIYMFLEIIEGGE